MSDDSLRIINSANRENSTGSGADNKLVGTIRSELKSICGNAEFDVPMRTRTSFRVGGSADAIIAPADFRELEQLLRYSAEKRIPCMILGRGTNMLVLDGGIRGILIDLKQFNTLQVRDDCTVRAGAGVPLQKTVYFAMEHALEGMEFAVGIPGSTGGGLIMNAGAWGAEIKDIVGSVVMMREDFIISEASRNDLLFSYRKLHMSDKAVILEATFNLRKGERETIKAKMTSYMNERRDRQPLELPNAGCVFKNPSGFSAGRIIDELGLKGLQFGGARISDVHANFIVNAGGATAKDILSLMDDIAEKVFDKKGIRLEPEITVVGEHARI